MRQKPISEIEEKKTIVATRTLVSLAFKSFDFEHT